MMTNDGISVADALALRNSGDDGGFGGNNAWWIIILILFMSMGWGRNGGESTGYNACCTPATQQGVTDAFNFNQLDNGVRSLANGLCDGFYAVNTGLLNGFNGVQQSIANLGYNVGQGFCGVDKAILQSDFHSQAGFNAITNQLGACCCELGRGQENIKYALAQTANQILVANDKNTDRIINYLTQTEMDKLRTELQSAQFQLSQLSQTSNIINQLMPVAKPAYLTCSPYAAAFGFNTFGGNCGCGCA
jgi:hypothetical protein